MHILSVFLVCDCIFCRNGIGKKVAHKTLVKLTTDHPLHIVALRHPIPLSALSAISDDIEVKTN